MLSDTDDAAIQADAYIDALLTGHTRSPVPVRGGSPSTPEVGAVSDVRDAIHMLEQGLPRFHPSFLFEEWLAGQLRRAAARSSTEASGGARMGEILPIGLMPRPTVGPARIGDRRLWVGGAVASGVSIGVAMFAWRRRRD